MAIPPNSKLLGILATNVMKKILLFIMGIVLLVNINLVFAHEYNFTDTKQLIDSGISCDKLIDEQLEAMGDYYMEQMHPGEAHKMMDQMMGGEGSESLKQVHIQMAKRLYCNEDVGGMMPMMGNNMMGSGGVGMMGSGMMGNWSYFNYWNFLNVLYIILLIGLIILVYFWIVKLWKDFYGKKK